MAATCYRHPGRETNVSCSNCGRPICPDCMTTTPVGMRCPECARQRTQVRSSVGSPGRLGRPGDLRADRVSTSSPSWPSSPRARTGLQAAARSIDDAGCSARRSPTASGTGSSPPASCTRADPHIAFNMFALYVLGTLLEPAIGTARFLGIYFVSLLAGSLGALLLSPDQLTVGASGAIFGLMAAAFVIARHRGLDQLASQIGFFIVINLVFTFGVSDISIGGHLGGLIGGGIAALVVNALHRRGDARLEIGALVALCVVTAVGAIVVANVQANARSSEPGGAPLGARPRRRARRPSAASAPS